MRLAAALAAASAKVRAGGGGGRASVGWWGTAWQLLVPLCGIVLLCGSGLAQGPVDAGIRGQVLDGAGAAVVWSHMVVRSVEDPDAMGAGYRKEFAASRDGSFVLLRLLPGTYEVRADAYAAGQDAVAMVRVAAGELAEVTLVLAAAGSAVATPTGALANAPVPAAEASRVSLERMAGEVSMGLPLSPAGWDVAELDSAANVAATAAREPGGAGEAEQNDEAAGADRASSDSGAAATGLSFAGMAAIQDAQTMDGLRGDQAFRAGPMGAAGGGPSAGASYGRGVVRSLRVMPRSFSAQFGGGIGGVLAVTSRGAETGRGAGIHGSAFVSLRESGWAAANPFSVATHYSDGAVSSATVKPQGSVVNVGAAAGLGLGGERRVPGRAAQAIPFGGLGRRPSAGVLGLAPARRIGLFASVEAELRSAEIVSTPAVASFFTLNPEQVALLGTRGVTPKATNGALNFLDSLTGTTRQRATRVLSFGRVDWAPGVGDRVAITYMGNRFNAPAGAALGRASDAVVARGTGSLGDSYVGMDAGTARWLHVFTPGWSSEMRGQVAHDLEYETPHAPLAQEPGIGPGGYAPGVSIAPNGFAYGTPANLGRTAWPDEHRVEAGETVQGLMGRHLVTAGMDWSRVEDRIASVTAQEGEFLYDSGTTGVTTNKSGQDGGLVDWITDYTFNVHAYPNGGCPSINATVHDFCFRSYTQGFGGAQTQFVMHDFAGFVEDAMRLRTDLTVTLGARFEYTLLPLPQAPNYALDAALKGLGRSGAGLTETFPEDRNNVGPRVAMVWSPAWNRVGGKARLPLFTVQAGYGVFFGRIPGATVRAALADTGLPSGNLHVRITPATEVQCPQVTGVAQGFGYPCAFTGVPAAAVAQTTSVTVFGGGFRVPAVQRAMLAMERDFGRTLFVRAEYATAMAVQLPGSRDANISPATGLKSFVLQGGDGWPGLRSGETFVVPVYGARPVTQYGPVTEVVSDANATYHAGSVEARVRRWGVEARFSYTFSRAIDYAPQSSATPRVNGQFDPFANGYDKGLSSLQYPQRFAGDLVYAVGAVRGPRWVKAAAEGWRMTAIATGGSGAPFGYQIYGGTRLSGGRESINGSGGAAYLPTVGRNTLRLPARSRVDARVSREFALPGRVRANVYASAFNVLNSVSLSSVETRAFLVGAPAATGAPTPLLFQDAATVASEGLATPAFGTPTSSTTGLSRERQVELGVRVRF